MTKQVDMAAIDDLLHRAGLRITRQRRTILQALRASGDHPHAETLLGRAKAVDPSVSQATTYRTLAALADQGLIRAHQFAGQASRYELLDRPHHDHMIDVDTGDIIEFVSAEIEQMQKRIAEEHGLEIVDHRLELYCRRRT